MARFGLCRDIHKKNKEDDNNFPLIFVFIFCSLFRIIRTDWDAGFIEGRQYGRGKSGGQVGNIYMGEIRESGREYLYVGNPGVR